MMAYSSRILKVFAPASPSPGTSRSRSSECLPVQSIRTSPGSSIAIASAAVTTPAVRRTGWDRRVSISSLSERSMALSGQNPRTQVRSRAIRSGAMDCRKARPSSSSEASNRASTLSPSM